MSGPGIISVLRNHFGASASPADVRVGHESAYITPSSIEAFLLGSDLALGDVLTSCHGRCDISDTVGCDERMCSGILKGLQEKFSDLPFSVRLF